MLMLMRAGILSGGMIVVAAVGNMSVSEKCFFSVTDVEVKCLGVSLRLVVGDIFDVGGSFVVVVVEMHVDALELEVEVVARLVWGCLNGRLYFLWRFSQISLEGKLSNVGECPFGMVMQKYFFMELFFFDGCCLRNVTGSKMGVLMVEMVVWMVSNLI